MITSFFTTKPASPPPQKTSESASKHLAFLLFPSLDSGAYVEDELLEGGESDPDDDGYERQVYQGGEGLIHEDGAGRSAKAAGEAGG